MKPELLEMAADLLGRHQPFLIATVVWARGPSSGKIGSSAIIEGDGEVTGWIGGACAQPVVIREAREAMSDGKPRLLFLGTPDDIRELDRPDVMSVPISCTSEGAMEVYLEPMLARQHLVVVGRSPAVQTLTGLAAALGWQVSVVDDGGDPSHHPGADRVISSLSLPDDVDNGTAIVIASQGHHDEQALEAALATDAGYVGLVASRRRGETVVGYLRDRGIPDSALSRVRSPAGLDLGRVEHREIAVAIVAELVALRASGELGGGRVVPGEPQHTVIDPVCRMEVEVAGARWISGHDGDTYYFCSPGCMRAFEGDPESFLARDAT